MLRKLVDIQYQRNDYDFHRGTFRVRGDTVEIFPAYEESRAVRVEFFGDEVEALYEIDPLRGKVIRKLQSVAIYPASHYVTTSDRMEIAVAQHPRGTAASASSSSAPRIDCSKPSASSSARCTISNCWPRWASVPGSKITRAI